VLVESIGAIAVNARRCGRGIEEAATDAGSVEDSAERDRYWSGRPRARACRARRGDVVPVAPLDLDDRDARRHAHGYAGSRHADACSPDAGGLDAVAGSDGNTHDIARSRVNGHAHADDAAWAIAKRSAPAARLDTSRIADSV